MSSLVAEYVRKNKQAISDDWERAVVRDLKELAKLDRAALIDHMPEVLDALAAFVEGDDAHAERLFSALADGHAQQRIAFGIELPALAIEYGWLRRVLLERLLSVASVDHVRSDLILLNHGMDRAIHHAVRRYSARRDRLRDRFIGILGHDLRGPLAAAWSAARVLESSTHIKGDDRRAVDVIGRAIERMSRMVDDVLDFARGHLGDGIPTTPIACDMGEICRSAVDEALAANPERRIELRAGGSLAGTFDRDRVQQTLGNLIGNAVAHGADPIVVEVAETPDRRAVVTRVCNRGKAIDPAIVGRLFDPFLSSSQDKSGRLGLGLYIVAEIARAHGATCAVSSTDEQTNFTIRWPRTPRTETPGRP
jgi:signal transduction histidine kinase